MTTKTLNPDTINSFSDIDAAGRYVQISLDGGNLQAETYFEPTNFIITDTPVYSDRYKNGGPFNGLNFQFIQAPDEYLVYRVYGNSRKRMFEENAPITAVEVAQALIDGYVDGAMDDLQKRKGGYDGLAQPYEFEIVALYRRVKKTIETEVEYLVIDD